MSNRTGQIGADVAWARPASIPVDLILGYSGPAFAGVAQIRAWGKPFLLGFESTTTRAYAGYAAGIADAQQLRSVAATLPGYLESSCGAWYCAADENSTPAWALPGITDYGRAFRDVFGPAVPLVPYGNPEARRAAASGSGAPILPWGIGTWREGEGGGPNMPPASSECALLQSGNTPGPAEGTDLDWLYTPLEAFRAWGGPAGAVQTEEVDDEMRIAIVQYRGHPEPRPTFRLFEYGDKVYRKQASDAELKAWAASGLLEMQQVGDLVVPKIPLLEAPEFSSYADVPPGGLGAGGTTVVNGTTAPTKFSITGTAVASG